LVSLKDSSPGTAHSQQSFRIKKASDLIGMSVQNPQGADLGDVQDLAIDAENGRVAYAVLSIGGFLGMGDKWFAIPTGALTLPGDGKHFVLDVDKNRLKSAPGFAKDKWPVMGNPAWGEEVHKFYGQQPYWMTEGEGSTPTDDQRIQKASEIMGRSVSNNRGETLGEIKDLVIDPDQYRVVYVVLKFGGFLGFGEKLFAIPTGVLQMPGSDGHAVLTVDKDRLTEAKGFDKDNWPNLADPTVSSGIFAFYGQKSYGAEDLHGGQYVTAKAGLTCHQCGRTMGARAFSRDGNMYCCAGCANGTGCTCGKVQNKPGS
jgi:sporulation protein YlmC with PRC-barrel domain